MPSRAVRNSLLPVSFYKRRRTIAATATATAFALALTTLNASAARAATPDWNLGNTEASQISNLNAQADGVVRNPGLGKCLDDLSGKTANGSTVDSSACTGSANQNWTFNPGSDYYWDLGFYGSVTLDGAPGKCLDIGSANGGAAASIAVGGAVQMMLTNSGEVYAKSGVGLGGWTKESDFEVQRITAGSDGTQMMVGGSRRSPRTAASSSTSAITEPYTRAAGSARPPAGPRRARPEPPRSRSARTAPR